MSSDGEIEKEHSDTEQPQSKEQGSALASQVETEPRKCDCAKKFKKSEVKINNKGNKIQFEFNQELLAKIEKLDKFLVKGIYNPI